jgi:hypothetical protein
MKGGGSAVIVRLAPLIPPTPFSHKGRRGRRLDPLIPPALKGRVLRSNARFAAFPRLLPLIPPAPFSHKGRKGSWGVLMPETEDGTQGLPQKPTPVSIPPAPFSHKGRRGSLGVLMPETREET